MSFIIILQILQIIIILIKSLIVDHFIKKIYLTMFNFKIFMFYYFYIMSLKYFINNVLCSVLEFENNNQFNLTERKILSKFERDITPFFSLTSYFICPINPEICYMFIENIISKQINHYTITFKKISSWDSLKRKLLFQENNLNIIFESCINNNLLKINEFENLKVFICEKGSLKCFELVKFMISKFTNIVCKINFPLLKTFTYKNNKPKKYFYRKKYPFKNIINDFLSICVNLRSSRKKIVYVKNDDYMYYKNVQEIEKYAKYNSIFFKNFIQITFESKNRVLSSLTQDLFNFCEIKGILNEHMLNYLFFKVKNIKNKLTQYTLFISCCNVFRFRNEKTKIMVVLKILIFIWVYLDFGKEDINNVNTIFLLYQISKIGKIIYYSYENIDEMCTLYQPHSVMMKLLIIKRYLFIYVNCSERLYKNCTLLLLEEKYFESIWLITQCCIKTKYVLFDLNF